MSVERVEAFLRVVVIVQRKSARMSVEREGAERAREPRQLDVQLLRMDALDLRDVSKRR